MTDKNTYPLSVHLVTYNSSLWLPYCLEALRRQTRQDFFLLVIDNGSVDNSAAWVANFLRTHPELGGRSRLVCNKQNLGFARAHNQALAWTSSTYVQLVNSDLVLQDNYLAAMAQRLDNQAEAGAAAGKILRWNFDPESFHLEALAELPPGSEIDSVGLGIKKTRQIFELGLNETDKGQYEVPHQVFGVSGAAPMYRRLALDQVSVNGEVFDEDFVSYKEDVDLAWRLRRGGWSAWYEPKGVAYHDRRLNAQGNLWQRARKRASWPKVLKVYSLCNHWGVLVKNEGFFNLLRDSWQFVPYEIGKSLYYILTEPGTFFQSLGRWLKLLPRFLAKRRALKPTRKLKPQAIRAWFIT